MGEMADMMLDGTLCEACGTYIDDDGAEGFPRYCSNQCARDRGATHALPNPVAKPNPDKANCPHCGKRVKAKGLRDHIRDTHGIDTRKARIMDAGPDLLAALEAVSGWDDQANPASYGGLPETLRATVDTAIAKATGK